MPALYSETLLDHFRRPRNYGGLEQPDVSNEQFNPLCGDRIRLELKFDGARVCAARFKGDACAIGTAAASLLTELIIGEEIEQLDTLADARLIAALQSNIQPARLQCALLPLQALREGLKHYRNPRTEGEPPRI